MPAKPWLGVPEQMLTSGAAVMVVAGGGGEPHYRPALICYATVDGPADEPGVWWLSVHYGGTAGPLPQMFRTEEIVGVPAWGLAP